MDTSLQITGPVTTVDELVPLFEPDMRELCDLTRGMFDVERDDQGNVLVSEVEKIYAAELKVIAKRKQAREMVDAAKDDLQGTLFVVRCWWLIDLIQTTNDDVQSWRG